MTEQHNALIPAKWSQHRLKEGSPAAADGSISGTFPNRRGLIGCDGYTTINATVRFTGGTNPTADLDVLAYDEDRDTAGAGYGFTVIDEHTGVVDLETVRCTAHRNRIFILISAITGSPDAIEVRVGPGEAAPWPQR